jgi:hypothetical protein
LVQELLQVGKPHAIPIVFRDTYCCRAQLGDVQKDAMLLEDTIKAIRAAERARRLRMAERRRLLRPVAQLDQILVELEELHLNGGIKLPAAMITRIEGFMRSLPAECHHDFPLRTTITRVMDSLYTVQDCLLSRKDRGRLGLQAMDSTLEEPMEQDHSAA